MLIERRCPAHQLLDQNMKRSLVNKIGPPNDVGHALDVVIMGDGNMIAYANIAPGNDGVRPDLSSVLDKVQG